MARSTTLAQPQPQPEPETKAKAAPSPSGGKPGQPVDYLAVKGGDNAARMERKQRLLTEAAQFLAEAHDGFGETDNLNQSAAETADKAIHKLYQGIADGDVTREEVSNTLCNIWGFKVSPTTGKASKSTPAGQGEVIRKRVNRLADAALFVAFVEGTSDVEPTSFFEELEAADVAPIVNEANAGGSAWTAYEKLTKLAAANRQRGELAFDAVKIAKLAAKIGESIEASAKIIRGNDALADAYAGLRANINLMSEAAGNLPVDGE